MTLVVVLSIPAFSAWDIPRGTTETPTFATPEPVRSWSSVPQNVAAVSAQVQSNAVSAAVKARGTWVEKPIATTGQPSFIKTAEDLKILNVTLNAPFLPNGQPNAVPEPGSIAGLSAGLLGLLYQVRRTRIRN